MQSIKHMNLNDMMWLETPYGRKRVYCKLCLSQGKDWLSPTPCEHILEADGMSVDPQQVTNKLQEITQPTEPEPWEQSEIKVFMDEEHPENSGPY